MLQLENGGSLGLTFCPGKKQANALTGAWDRDLKTDLDAIRNWGADGVVCLVEAFELDELQVAGLPRAVGEAGLRWFHLPIVDQSIPGSQFEDDWVSAGSAIRRILDGGGSVLIHCKGGLGRTGLVAARLLVEYGIPPVQAICRVRAVRPGAIENSVQERYVMALAGVAG